LQASTFLEPNELFKGEIEETIDKVRKACDVLKGFKEEYEVHRKKLSEYFKDDKEPREWEFTPKLVFARYDKFCERVETVKVSFKYMSFISIYCKTKKHVLTLIIFLNGCKTSKYNSFLLAPIFGFGGNKLEYP